MEIIPLQDYVVIQEAEDIVGKSVILVDADIEPKNQGKIIKLPENVGWSSMSLLKEGDLVIFRRHMFDNLDEILNDKLFKGLVLGKQEYVIAIIKPHA